MKIADEDLVVEVRRLVAESPDFIYQMKNPPGAGGPVCLYVSKVADGYVGDCLLGQALVNLGVDVEVLAKFDALDDSAAEYVLPQFGVSSNVVDWANVVQIAQDTGDCWSGAIDEADRKVKLDG